MDRLPCDYRLGHGCNFRGQSGYRAQFVEHGSIASRLSPKIASEARLWQFEFAQAQYFKLDLGLRARSRSAPALMSLRSARSGAGARYPPRGRAP